jgi:hypothetical protein
VSAPIWLAGANLVDGNLDGNGILHPFILTSRGERTTLWPMDTPINTPPTLPPIPHILGQAAVVRCSPRATPNLPGGAKIERGTGKPTGKEDSIGGRQIGFRGDGVVESETDQRREGGRKAKVQ